MRKLTIGLLFLFTIALLNFQPAFGQDAPPVSDARREIEQKIQESARILVAAERLKELSKELEKFHDVDEHFPPQPTGTVALLPFLETKTILPYLETVKEGGHHIKIYKLKNASASSAQKVLHTIFADDAKNKGKVVKFATDQHSNSLVVVAEPEFHKNIDALLEAIDKKAGDVTDTTIDLPRNPTYATERKNVGPTPELLCTMYELENAGNREASAKLNKIVAENKFLKGAGTKIMAYPGDESTLVFWSDEDMKPILEMFIAQIDAAAKPATDTDSTEKTGTEPTEEPKTGTVPADTEKTASGEESKAGQSEATAGSRVRTLASEQIAASISASYQARINDLASKYQVVDDEVQAGNADRVALLSSKLELFRAKEDLYRWSISRATTKPEIVRNRGDLRKILEEQEKTAEEFVGLMLKATGGDHNSPLMAEVLSGQALLKDVQIKVLELDLEEAEME